MPLGRSFETLKVCLDNDYYLKRKLFEIVGQPYTIVIFDTIIRECLLRI